LVTAAALNIQLPVLTDQRRSELERQRETIARDLAEMIEGDVRFGRHDRMLYATDASLYQVEPIGVVCPRTVEDVEKVVRYCGGRNVPILPRGGGTSLAGQAVNTAIVIDFSVYLRGVLEVNPTQRWVRVQPGVVPDQLNASLAPHGLMFGPDVASGAQANIGGMIGNNSAGARSILYGRTVEHVRDLDVLLADASRLRFLAGASESDPPVRDLTQRIANIILPREAEIERRFPTIVRHVDGYNLDIILRQIRESTPGTFDRVNLAHLVCGSEGTLAVTLGATLNLVPAPQQVGLALVACPDVDDALGILTAILQTRPSAVELIDDMVIDVARRNRDCARHVELLPRPRTGALGAVLYVEYFADDHAQLTERLVTLQRVIDGRDMVHHTDRAAMAQAWTLRRAGEPLLHTLPGARKPYTFIEDLAVDPARLASFVRDFKALLARHGTTAAFYAHASVGCLHIRPLVNVRDAGDAALMQTLAEHATDLVVHYDGALSGEHGDGRLRSHLLERYFGRDICEAFRAIKAVFDPQNLMNPGNIVAPGPMLEHVRVRPIGRSIEVPHTQTFFNYECEGGFGEAVERCNGAGVCRKMKTGTMCPSYRATLDERHSTRGRGNALRLAITGQLSADGSAPFWNDPETNTTLDLCLSCKACKSECPSNVDMAKLKAEYLAQGFARGEAVPLAARVFGNIRTLNRLGSAMHPLANAACRFAPLAAVARWALNLHPRRELPRFDQSLHRWMKHRADAVREHSHILKNVRMSPPSGGIGRAVRTQRAVVLFPDCFTTYIEPRIGQAAVLTLEALGYRVIVPNVGCCGRAHISTGQLAQAQKVCRHTAVELRDIVAREAPIAIVGCEPSCISAIKDDWLDLDMNMDRSSLRDLADRTHMIEQFLDTHWTDLSMPPGASSALNLSTASAVLHAHCHQKALWGVDSSAAVLRRLLGDRLHVLDSGCCGMAGSFGYTRDHYDLSMKIGEQSLFGTLRHLEDDAIVLAPGTSCRQQICDGVARKALHPIEFIAQMIGAIAGTHGHSNVCTRIGPQSDRTQ
jgi:FAD/FMN-containing dehydrogenase/Fe-S oxidoreductase